MSPPLLSLFAAGSLTRRVAIRAGALALGITLALWAAVLFQQSRRTDAVLEQETRRAEALARSTAELAQRVLAVADRALSYAGRAIEAGDDPQAAVDTALAHTGLDGEVITSLRFLDPKGRALGERITRPLVQAAPEDFSDREFFRVHVESPTVGLHLSRTMYGRQAGARVFVMSRRLDHVDGRMRGVLQVGLDATWLASLLHHVGQEMGVSITLIGEDGAVRVRVSTEGELGFDRAVPDEHPLLRLLQARRVSARLDQPSWIEPSARLLAMRRLDSYPLAIVVGEQEEALKARTASDRRVALSLLGVASLVLWAAFVAALALVGRIERTRHALRGALGRARAASRAKSAFLGSLSHELRTPLTVILGYAALIEQRSPDALARELAGTLRGSARRLAGLIDEVLDAARAESGALSVTLAPEPIRELVGEACALYAPAAEARGARLDCRIDEAVPEHVACDAMRMRQVLNVLLSNAVGRAANGTITVRMRTADRVDGAPPAAGAPAVRSATDDARGTGGPWLRIDVVDAAGGGPGDAPAGRLAGPADATASPDASDPEFAQAGEFMRRMGGALALAAAGPDGTTATVWLPLSHRPLAPPAPARADDTVPAAA